MDTAWVNLAIRKAAKEEASILAKKRMSEMGDFISVIPEDVRIGRAHPMMTIVMLL